MGIDTTVCLKKNRTATINMTYLHKFTFLLIILADIDLIQCSIDMTKKFINGLEPAAWFL